MAKRCACAVASGAIGFGVTLGASSIGAAIGTAIFPGIGTAIGAFVGLISGVVASFSISKGIDTVGDLIVDDETEIDLMLKDQMYSNALKRLDLKDSATNDEVSMAKKAMWAIHHPDGHAKKGEKEQEDHI